MLDVLVDYDERVWPRHYARDHFHRTGMWRTALDTVLAERILRGDDEVLSRRLRAFAHIGEDLRELLQLLATNASTPPRIDRIHAIWPQILDHLLPDARVLTVGSGRRERPYHRHVQELDGALLLVPPEEATQWPAEKTFEIGASLSPLF